jgi:hypothetical protein
MNNVPEQLAPERLIQRTIEFLKEMKQLDRIIELNGYQFVLSSNPEKYGSA